MPPRVRDARRGFTLVELMVVVAIVAILATMAIAYSGEAHTNVKSFAADVVGEADTARLRAISTRRWNRLGFDLVNHKVVVEQSTTTGMGTPAADEWELFSQFDLPKFVEIYAITTTSDIYTGNNPTEGQGLDRYITFSPDGSSFPTTVYLHALDGASATRVVVYRATGTAYAEPQW